MDDPNTWNLVDNHEHRIYGDDRATTYAVVDAVDYQWAVRWKWHINKPHPARNGQKKYMVRSQSNGRRAAPKLFLHVEILKRSKKRKPSPLHKIGDHEDGDELNCRRANLHWVTPKKNNRRLKRGGNHGAGKARTR